MITSHDAGLAALSICESILLSLTDNKLIDDAEARAILTDAAQAHRSAPRSSDTPAHDRAAILIEEIRDQGNAVRHIR